MDGEEKKRTLSFLEKLKHKAVTQENYGGEVKMEAAKMDVRNCPECGAGRTPNSGLTVCAYCGFKFMDVTLSDGIHVKKENNS